MRNKIIAVAIFALGFTACASNDDYAPKPAGYFRINYPARTYRDFNEAAPFKFSYPAYGVMAPDPSTDAAPYWYNLSFPQFNGRLHLTYYTISSVAAYDAMVEDARKLAFKHTIKASGLDQTIINYPAHKVYGVYYQIEGNTASSLQFFLTDSTRHYFRGALYFNERPQYDSIAPVIAFIKKDIDKMISTFEWKKQ